MIAYQELMEHVDREGGASDNEEARLALEATAEALARNTDPDTREHLRRLMPAALRDHIPQQPGAPAMESGELSEEVARRVGCPREQGVRLAGAVLSGIHREQPELAEELASRLPDELAEWARDPDGARGRADTGQTDTPGRLDQSALEQALAGLPDWQGGAEGLTRSVDLPADRFTPLLNQAHKAARELGHGFEHDTTDTGIAFTVRTASVGAVTTRDIEMAERIDAAIAKIGSGG